jgi:hypothetical protein
MQKADEESVEKMGKVADIRWQLQKIRQFLIRLQARICSHNSQHNGEARGCAGTAAISSASPYIIR